jgi:hypothetical protein
MMRRAFVCCMVWAVLVSAVCAKDSGFFFHDGDRVVFLGDSITEQKLYTTYIEAYTLTRFPSEKFTFRNVGWGGDTAWLRQRAHPDEGKLFAAKEVEQKKMVENSVGAGLARDVLPLKPTAVTVDFGMNDHSYQPFREDIFRAYVRSQSEIVKVLASHGTRVALLTPQPIEERRPDPDKDQRNQSLRRFSDGLKAVCAADHALFVDQFDPYMAIMMKQRSKDPKAFIGGGDAVHPGPAGHTLMAWAILKGLKAPALVSRVELLVTDAGAGEVKATENCHVSTLKCDGGALSFDRLDEALPMPIDRRAEPALKLAPVLRDLDRYMLKVTGLTADRYQLKIDGEPAGTVSKAALARGHNLATCPGPINRQVQKVLELVFAKNDLYFQRWRNVQLAGGHEAQLRDLDAKIRDFESKIESARVPKSHYFELMPAVK